MKRKYALFFAMALTLIIAGNYYVLTEISDSGEEVIVKRAIDGDTIETLDGRRIRLVNINALEKDEKGSEEAIDFLKSFENKSVKLKITGIEKYGRILGKIYDEEYINLEIVREGLAHPYLVEEGEKTKFLRAAEEARRGEIGIWKKSEHYGCIEAEINKQEEYLIVIDNCDLDMKGWTIKDESSQYYLIKKSVESQFILWSGDGKETKEDLFWGRGNSWNNDHDAIFIRDSDGLLVYYFSY